MKLTPGLYSQLVEYEAGQYLLEIFGSRIQFCSWRERPSDLWSDGLAKIDGVVVPYFVDFAEPREGTRALRGEVRDIKEPLSRWRLQQYLDLKVRNEVNTFLREVDSLLLVVRADYRDLEITDDVLEQARQHGLHIRRLHLKDDGATLTLIDLEDECWGDDCWEDPHEDDDLYEVDGLCF